MHPIRWINERLGLGSVVRGFLDRPIPANVGWWRSLAEPSPFS